MREEMSTPFLPLGSVLKLDGTENNEQLYFIVARAVAKNEEGITARYRVAPHPYGDVPSQEVFSINANQIIEVLFEGFHDQADKVFLDDLLVRISQAQNQQPPVQEEKVPIVENIEKNEEEQLNEDPFYQFR